MSVRLHGKPPYQIALVHQPGISGVLGSFARSLSERYGVIELIQTKDSLEELLIEMVNDLSHFQEQQIVLIGHSYGGWIAGLYASKRIHNINKLILIGSPPLDSNYDYIIEIKRRLHYNDEQLEEFNHLTNLLRETSTNKEKDKLLRRYDELCKLADEYQPITNDNNNYNFIQFNGTRYSEIMLELMQLRDNGGLLDIFKKLNIMIALIHGEFDTHPLDGVLEPFLKSKIQHTYCLLEDCGHSPWMEMGAWSIFQRVLVYEIKDAFSRGEN